MFWLNEVSTFAASSGCRGRWERRIRRGINGSGVSGGPAADGVSVAGGTGFALCVVVGNGVMVLAARGVSVIGMVELLRTGSVT